jgi:hypothetical protein
LNDALSVLARLPHSLPRDEVLALQPATLTFNVDGSGKVIFASTRSSVCSPPSRD